MCPKTAENAKNPLDKMAFMPNICAALLAKVCMRAAWACKRNRQIGSAWPTSTNNNQYGNINITINNTYIPNYNNYVRTRHVKF